MVLLGMFTIIVALGGFIWLMVLQDEVSTLKVRIAKLQSAQEKPSCAAETAKVQTSPAVQNAQVAQAKQTAPVQQPVIPAQKSTMPVKETPQESMSIVQVFSWVGGFALLLGIGFVVKYAIDNQWLSAQVRIMGSIILGVGLWVTGICMDNPSHRTTANTLSASGVAIYYIAFFAAFHYYSLVGLSTVFVMLTFTSLLAFGTSLWKDSQGIGVLAQIIGFIVPFLLPSEQPNWFFLLSYTAFISLASIGVAWKKNWDSLLFVCLGFVGFSLLVVLCRMPLAQLNLLFGFCLLFGAIFGGVSYQRKRGDFLLGSALVTFMILGGYLMRCLGVILPTQAPYFLTWTIALILLYSVPIFIFPARFSDSISSWITLLFVLGFGAAYIYFVGYFTYDIKSGILPFLFMCVSGLVFYGVSVWLPKQALQRSFALAGLGILSIFFLTWGIICQFDKEFLTLFLALEGCAFLFLAKYKRVPWLHGVSIGLVGLALTKLFFVDIWALEILPRIIVLIGVAAVLILGAFLYQNFKPEQQVASEENK